MKQRLPVGASLRALREYLGLTQRQMGEKLGWTRQKVSYLETGKFYPSLEALFLIAEKTEIDASRIIKNVEKRIRTVAPPNNSL